MTRVPVQDTCLCSLERRDRLGTYPVRGVTLVQRPASSIAIETGGFAFRTESTIGRERCTELAIRSCEAVVRRRRRVSIIVHLSTGITAPAILHEIPRQGS
jgi:hypothetical protein